MEVEFEKRESAERLREKVKEGRFDLIILATDPDREGEAIAYHVKEELLDIGIDEEKIKRVRFYSITKDEIKRKLENLDVIDFRMVESQVARRVIDRLVGYIYSEVLSRELKTGVSVGRVQTPALRILVEKEEERERFQIKDYWYYWGLFSPFFASGISYVFTGSGERIYNERVAKHVYERYLKGGTKGFKIRSIKEKRKKVYPPKPLTTSKLLIEGCRYSGFRADDIMKRAQKLYERGYITYVRTDSYRVSEEGLKLAEEFITEKFGEEYLGLNDYSWHRGDYGGGAT